MPFPSEPGCLPRRWRSRCDHGHTGPACARCEFQSRWCDDSPEWSRRYRDAPRTIQRIGRVPPVVPPWQEPPRPPLQSSSRGTWLDCTVHGHSTSAVSTRARAVVPGRDKSWARSRESALRAQRPVSPPYRTGHRVGARWGSQRMPNRFHRQIRQVLDALLAGDSRTASAPG
jgi:hypothetical protein